MPRNLGRKPDVLKLVHHGPSKELAHAGWQNDSGKAGKNQIPCLPCTYHVWIWACKKETGGEMMGLRPLRAGRLCSESLTYGQLVGEPAKIPLEVFPALPRKAQRVCQMRARHGEIVGSWMSCPGQRQAQEPGFTWGGVPGFHLSLSQGQATALDSQSLRSRRAELQNNRQKPRRTR